jgi:pectate lyase
MKLSSVIAGLPVLAQIIFASPTPTENKVNRAIFAKRASVTETPTTGYATLNGG